MSKWIYKYFLIFPVLIIGGLSLLFIPEPKLKPFTQPKFSDIFHSRFSPTFFNYNEAFQIAQKNDRLLFVSFTGYAVVGDRSCEYWPIQYDFSREFIKRKMIYCELYVDSKSPLDSSEMILNQKDSITNIGRLNHYIQMNTFGTYGQPYNVIIDPISGKISSGFVIRNNLKNNWNLVQAYYSR